jgi:hypothetical protein
MKRVEPAETANKRENFVEGVDYYFENGLMVLTAHFLLERGFCCGNGCRHCPYPTEPTENLQ